MSKMICTAAALAVAASAASADVTVGLDPLSSPNPASGGYLGFLNVFEINPDNTPGAFVFPSGWGVGDLVAIFDDANGTVEMQPNQIGDPNEFWYQNTTGMAADPVNPGGPGQLGNKFIDANLFQQVTQARGEGFSGQTVTFEGNVTEFTLDPAYTINVFIRDFAPDFSSFNESIMEITGTGTFSISLDTLAGDGRNVQWGIQMLGRNVWVTDAPVLGSVVFGPIPTPGAVGAFGLAGLVAARRRRA